MLQKFEIDPNAKLTPGQLYGLRKPEFAGDPAMIIPYGLVAASSVPDVVIIRALDARDYEFVSVQNQPVNDLSKASGLLPSMFPEDDANSQPRERSPGPMAHPVTDLSSPNSIYGDVVPLVQAVPQAPAPVPYAAAQESAGLLHNSSTLAAEQANQTAQAAHEAQLLAAQQAAQTPATTPATTPAADPVASLLQAPV